MCHRHTPSSKRNLSSKIFAESAATYFSPLTYVEILEEYLGRAALGAPFLESYALLMSMSMAVVTGVYGEANAVALL